MLNRLNKKVFYFFFTTSAIAGNEVATRPDTDTSIANTAGLSRAGAGHFTEGILLSRFFIKTFDPERVSFL